MENQFCRFCLKVVEDKHFEIISKFTREIIDVLFLKINLDVYLEPLMCSTCSKKLRQFFDFKCTCLYTEDSIAPFVQSNKTECINLLDVWIQQKNDEGSNIIHIPKDQKLCRLCMSLVFDGFEYLAGTERDTVLVREFLREHLPELNCAVTKDPVVCTICYGSCLSYSNFINVCSAVESNIERFHSMRKSDNVKLSDFTATASESKFPIDLHETASETKISCKVEAKIELKPQHSVSSEEIAVPASKPSITLATVCKYCTDNYSGKAKFKRIPFESHSTLEIKGCRKCIDKEEIVGFLKTSILRYASLTSKNYRCRLCWYMPKSRIVFKAHILRHKYRTKRIKFVCDICGFESMHVNPFNGHMYQHNHEQECDYCPFVTKAGHHLRKHLLKHFQGRQEND